MFATSRLARAARHRPVAALVGFGRVGMQRWGKATGSQHHWPVAPQPQANTRG